MSNVPDVTRTYERGPALLAASYLVVLAWIELITVVAVLVAHGLTKSPTLNAPFIVALVLFIGTAAAYAVLALSLRCSVCGKRILAQGLHRKKDAAETIAGMDDWAIAVVQVLSKRGFRCIHCGTRFTL